MKFVFVSYGKILCIGDFPESKCGFFFGKILWIGDFPEFRSGSNHGVTVNSWVEKDWVSRYILRVCFELVWCVSVSAVDFFLGSACPLHNFFGCSALARGASHGIWNSTFPLPWGARGAILAAALHALTAGA